MGIFDRFRKEKRSSIENPSGTWSAAQFMDSIGLGAFISAAGVTVNTESALGVPAVWAAVNFLSGTIAGLPLHVYRRKKAGRERVTGGIADIMHDAVNDEMSSFDWRKMIFDQVFTGGRCFTFIERNKEGNVTNLFPLDPSKMEVKRIKGSRIYEYRETKNSLSTFAADEIIDIAFMLKPDGLKHRSPIGCNKDAIGLAIAANAYGSRFFQNGGVPPFAVTGGFKSANAMTRAAEDLAGAVRKSTQDARQALILPDGLEIKTLGVDPEKTQLVETQRFIIEQVARIYSLPPTFLQDLSHGTFSNTEQQDLHFVKHTIKRWIEQTEQELNLKIFGRGSNKMFIEFNMDGLLRGDFQTRMEGYSKGIQNAIMTPNEVRRRENLPDDPNGDVLVIQGATVPLGTQPAQTTGANNGS